MWLAAPPITAPSMANIAGNGKRVGDFLLGKHEVTWAEYLVAVDLGGCAEPQNGYKLPISPSARIPRDNYPVTGITTGDVECYLSWLNQKTGRRFRLPTSAEWLWAARFVQPRHWTSLDRASAADLVRSDPRSAVREAVVNRTGTSEPSKEGVYDLEGNAMERLRGTRVISSPKYKKLCEIHGQGFCRQSEVIGSGAYNVEQGAEKAVNFREISWIAQADPMISVGFRLAETP